MLRFILAISVVFAHTYGFLFVGGRLAVQLFYMISGFLISYVLTEVKAYPNALYFYRNRFLRLYPLYWLVALITLLVHFIILFSTGTSWFFDVYSSVGNWGRFLLIFSNIFIFGQDVVMFTGVRDGVFQFVSDFNVSEVPVWHGLLASQGWTLGVELAFYLIAPFVLKRKAVIFSLIIASVLIRVFLVRIGIGMSDPWIYRFFPTELVLFLLGSLSQQYLMNFYRRVLKDRIGLVSFLITGFVALYCLIFSFLPLQKVNYVILVLILFLSLPLLFEFQLKNKWDKILGDLSYPIYISHILVFLCVSYFCFEEPVLKVGNFGSASLVVFITVVFSFFVEKIISKRVEGLRSKFRRI